ncbi:MAG: hypothetical protein KC561_15610, partial [Myxococcales bacterium]|nr:hypothetical protein [Myxococcales bacterium]
MTTTTLKAFAILILLGVVTPGTLVAQSNDSPVVGGRARLLVETGGLDGPLAPILDESVGSDSFGASIRFQTADVSRWEAGLDAIGVKLHRVDGELVCVGRVCGANVPFSALDLLASVPGIERVEAAWRPLLRRPLADTISEIGGHTAHDLGPALGLTGEGVLIADFDQPIDFFHPAFFNADGDFYDWIDRNGNGTFDVGDAIDLNANGVADEGESASVLDATEFWWDEFDFYEENNNGSYQVNRDWVYLDLNNNGRRDYGRSAGFSESDATYGEPLFIADDIDRDERVDADERFIALGSSKLSALVWGEDSYDRGS